MTSTGDASPRYWPRYCEENVWHRCASTAAAGFDEALAVLITNRSRRVIVLQQRASSRADGLIGWDYHVVFAARRADRWQIFDPDSRLPCPAEALAWLYASFPVLPEPLAGYRPMFRLVEAATYRARFASDRRHMRDSAGHWLSEPPPWPEIGRGYNLDRLLDPDDAFAGPVVDLAGIRTRFAAGATG